MRNWVVSEVKGLKNVPVTNVLFDPFERAQVSMASSGFSHRPQSNDREPPGFCGLSKILTEGRKLRHGDTQKNTIFYFQALWLMKTVEFYLRGGNTS